MAVAADCGGRARGPGANEGRSRASRAGESKYGDCT